MKVQLHDMGVPVKAGAIDLHEGCAQKEGDVQGMTTKSTKMSPTSRDRETGTSRITPRPMMASTTI